MLTHEPHTFMEPNQKTTLKLFTPYEAQKEIVKTCIDLTTKYIVYNASRQSGKTFLMQNMAVYYALNLNDQHIMVVSPVDSQSKKIYKQILNSIIHLPYVKSYKIQAGDSEIAFTNGSVILFRSAASTNSLRGYSNTHLLMDECAFVYEETWTTILAPTLLVRGKKVIFGSTPRGKNFFYKLFLQGKDPENKSFKSFKTTYIDNPYANIEFIEQQRKILPIDIFEQEYMAEFVDGGSLFKNIKDFTKLNKLSGPRDSETYFAGIDVGFKNDFTVISIFNQRAELVYIDRFNQTSNDEILRRIVSSLNLFRVCKCYIESNSFGLPIIEQLISRGAYQVEGFATTSTSKPLIINDLIYDFNGGKIQLLNDPNIISEMEAFGYSISKKGNVTYQANYGHDDIIMSLAIGYYCMKQNQYSGSFIFQ